MSHIYIGSFPVTCTSILAVNRFTFWVRSLWSRFLLGTLGIWSSSQSWTITGADVISVSKIKVTPLGLGHIVSNIKHPIPRFILGRGNIPQATCRGLRLCRTGCRLPIAGAFEGGRCAFFCITVVTLNFQLSCIGFLGLGDWDAVGAV